MGLGIVSDVDFVCKNSDNILIKPLRWCSRNISQLGKISNGSLLSIVGKKIVEFIVAFFSVLALSLAVPLASLGIMKELLSSKCNRNTQKINQTDLLDLAKQQLQTMAPDELDQDWKLKDFFGQIYVINLEQAAEKRIKFIENAKKVGLKEGDFSFFRATYGRTELDPSVWNRVDNNYCDIDTSSTEGRAKLDKQHQGQAGCFMSHYKVIKEAKRVYDEALNKVYNLKKAYSQTPSKELEEQLKAAELDLQKKSRVLVMEDDNAFGKVISTEPDLNKHNLFGDSASLDGLGKVFREGLLDLPADWDMLYLEAFQMFPYWENVNKNSKIGKLTACWTANAYIVNANAFDRILRRLEKIEKGNATLKSLDDEYADMHKEGYVQAYGFYPSIAYQNCMGQSSIAESGDQVMAKKDCWQQAEWGRPVVTYAGDGSRFGDQLINYIKALFLADQHKLPLVYSPFKFSDKMALSEAHYPRSKVEKKYYVVSNKLTGLNEAIPLTKEQWEGCLRSTKYLLDSMKNFIEKRAHIFEVSFYTDMKPSEFDNDQFRTKLQKVLKPIKSLSAIKIPVDCCSVALHVRKGGGYDTDATIRAFPTKFPPDDFYLKALKNIAEQHKGKKLFVYLFTDDPAPKAIKAKYMDAFKKFGLHNEIEWACREDQNKHDLNVMEDFFGMTQFDCLVRSDSSFSLAADILSGPRISITPPWWNGWNQRDKDGQVIVDQVKISKRDEKGKGTAKESFLSC